MQPNSFAGRRHSAAATLLVTALCTPLAIAQNSEPPTYAERLGWAPGDRVAIFHIDDVGMSHESNLGTIRSLEAGVATSLSIMMPCSWVPEFVDYLKGHPDTDAGLHLTLTSEWRHYRWEPLAGAPANPGLVDEHGYLHRDVAGAVANASPDEVEREIRAQIAKARAMGFEPTHLDSHMGTLFASPAFLERYIKVGVEEQIPIMFPGGHTTLLAQQYRDEALRRAQRNGTPETEVPDRDPSLALTRSVGEQVWAAGLPVLDDLHNVSYGWRPEPGEESSDEALTRLKVDRYADAVRSLQPGVTMIILHATDAGVAFDAISDSGPTRRGDMLAMLSPELKRVIEEEGVILSTFRELHERRKHVAAREGAGAP